LVEGTVPQIYEAGIKDVVFILKGNDTHYYINRGLENGLVLNELKDKLIGQKIKIWYPKYWTPLDPKNAIRHLSKLALGQEVIFNELRKTD